LKLAIFITPRADHLIALGAFDKHQRSTRTKPDTLPEVRQSLLEQGFEAEPGPPEAMLARLKDDIERWREVVAKAKVAKP
jgi:hypothetical protein